MAMQTIYYSSSDLPYESKDGFGFVYVVSKAVEGPSKVGIAVNPRKRIYGLETANGQRFERIWLSKRCSNFAEIEKAVHEKLRDARILGEWFDLPFGYAGHIASEMRYATAPDADWEMLLRTANRVKPPTPEIEARAIQIERELGMRP